MVNHTYWHIVFLEYDWVDSYVVNYVWTLL